MPQWFYRVEEFHTILGEADEDDEVGSVAKTKERLLPLLEKPPFLGLRASTLVAIREATTFHTFNRALDQVYDYADQQRIWLGI